MWFYIVIHFLASLRNTCLAFHEFHHLIPGYNLLLHLEHHIVDHIDVVHDAEHIIRTGNQIADHQISIHNKQCTDGNAADIGELLDTVKYGLKRCRQLYLFYIRFFQILIGSVEFFFLDLFIGKRAHQTHGLNIFLNRQVHITVAGTDVPEVYPCKFFKPDQRHNKKRDHDHRNDQKIRIDRRKKNDRCHKDKCTVDDIRYDTAEHFLKHDRIGVDRCQKFSCIVIGDRRTV